MRISFRQGIVRAPSNFLQSSGSSVNLSITIPSSLILAFADGTADYLVTERLSVSNAWPGPFTSGAQSYWLYVDLNAVTGARTFGHTLLAPVDGSTAPVSPANNQHWFDTAANQMKVWNTAVSRWVPRIRVFAGEYVGGAVFASVSINAPAFTGTQVGSLQSIDVDAGALVYDADSSLVRHVNGKFVTTEDVFLTGVASSSHVKFGSIVIEAEATETIPAFSLVRFTDFNKVSIATNYVVDNAAYGILDVDAASGDVVSITMEGLITNAAWDWTTAGINAALYVDNSGTLTTTPPAIPIPVAAVVDVHSILLRPSSLFLNTSNDPASTSNPGAVTLSVAPVSSSSPIAVGDNDPRVTNAAAAIVVTALTSGTTIAWNMANGKHATLTLAHNATLSTPTNMPAAGTLVVLKVTQDGTGGRTLAYGSAFKWTAGVAPTVSATAGQVTMLHFWSNGTNLYELSRALNVA